jgi:type I restriction enzyme S subunit
VFHSGDLLYGKLRPYLNKVCLIDFDGVCSTDILVMPKLSHVSNKFLAYRMLANDFVAYASQNVSGVQHPRVHFRILAEFPIALPPLPEQRRIVDKIDELVTRLDAGLAELNRVQANLARYEASVLKAACEGRLVPTEAELARAEGRDYESGEELLQRILAERKKKWEEEQRAKGKDPSKMRYKEPEAPDTEDLPEPPEGWVWAKMDQLGSIMGGLTKNRKREENSLKLPYLRVANVYANELRLDDVNLIGVREQELDRVLLEDQDLLIVEGNGSLDQIGRVAIWNGIISPCVHQNHIIKVRFEIIDLVKFILYWLLSDLGRIQITRVASSTSGLYTLSLTKVSNLPIP